MKILFKNTTKYDKENCGNFIEFHSKKFGKKEKLKMVLVCILILYMLVFNVIYKNWGLILGTIMIAFIIYLIEKNKAEKKANKREDIKEFTFYFCEKHIKIKYKRQFERLKYFQIHKIYETDEYFFLYLNETSSLILNKAGFEVGTPKKFAKFIKSKCPFKYRTEEK